MITPPIARQERPKTVAARREGSAGGQLPLPGMIDRGSKPEVSHAVGDIVGRTQACSETEAHPAAEARPRKTDRGGKKKALSVVVEVIFCIKRY